MPRNDDHFNVTLGSSIKSLPPTLNSYDSEAIVQEFGKPWLHLSKRVGDGWKKPKEGSDAHCHLMAQAMEAWFFADPDALERFFGSGFSRSAIPQTVNVEDIPKERHVESLERAARGTKKKTYRKFDHGPAILGELNVNLVRRRAPHCDRIFVEIGRLIGTDLSLPQ